MPRVTQLAPEAAHSPPPRTQEAEIASPREGCVLGLVAEASTAARASCLRETLETTGEGLGTCLPQESSGLRPWPPAQVLALTQGNSRWELSVCFPNKLKFIYFLKALQRERGIFYLLVHSPTWPQHPVLGQVVSCRSPRWGTRDPKPLGSLLLLSRVAHRDWIRSRTARTRTGALMGCWRAGSCLTCCATTQAHPTRLGPWAMPPRIHCIDICIQ